VLLGQCVAGALGRGRREGCVHYSNLMIMLCLRCDASACIMAPGGPIAAACCPCWANVRPLRGARCCCTLLFTGFLASSCRPRRIECSTVLWPTCGRGVQELRIRFRYTSCQVC